MLSVNSIPTFDIGEPAGPMMYGTTYIVRPFIEPSKSFPSLSYASAGAIQLFVGPASSFFVSGFPVESVGGARLVMMFDKSLYLHSTGSASTERLRNALRVKHWLAIATARKTCALAGGSCMAPRQDSSKTQEAPSMAS